MSVVYLVVTPMIAAPETTTTTEEVARGEAELKPEPDGRNRRGTEAWFCLHMEYVRTYIVHSAPYDRFFFPY